jgi:RNA polymerase sigma-70 factor (ECF subfamily)
MTCLDPMLLADLPSAMPGIDGVPDEELVEMLQRGLAEQAMCGIQNRYGRRLFHFVQGMVREPHLAQDVVQEVMEKVLLKHSLYQPGTNFRAWLFEVARNQALSALRAQRRLPRPVSNLGPDEDSDGNLLDLVPSGPEDRSLEEAATRLGLPTGTVAIRIMRARKRLFGSLERHLDRLRRPPACFQ